MSQKKLYVGNLPFQTAESDLREAFSAHGEVESVTVVMDRETGRSRGFAFVEMATPEAANAAIAAMDGKELGGRRLRVNIATPREDRGPRGGGGGGGWGGGGGGGGGGYGGDRGGGGGGYRGRR
jgi:RNA recognition motif-containing protein